MTKNKKREPYSEEKDLNREKRYWLFYWQDYHPYGGADDLVRCTDDIDEAYSFFQENREKRDEFDPIHCQVLDTVEMKVLFEGE